MKFQFFTDKSILLISPESWGSNFVSKHHYARTLARAGNKVYFLNPPAQDWNIRKEEEHLFIVDYRPTYRGLGRLPAFLCSRLIRKEIQRLEKLANTQFEVIWNFNTSSFFNLSAVAGHVLKISHIVDLSENFQRKLSSSTADICLCTTDFIKAELKAYNQNTYKIHHGYTLSETFEKVEDLPGHNNIKAGYIGNLMIPYLDWDLIEELIRCFSEVDFIFIGPFQASNLSHTFSEAVQKLVSNLSKHPNAFFLGSRPSPQIPAYLEQMDVLLLTYKAKEYVKQLASPHKMMEYLGSGKPVVATYTDEYKDKRELLEMVDERKAFIECFRKVIENLEAYQGEDQKKRRQQFALENTYARQLEKIEKIVCEFYTGQKTFHKV